ncbi:hypothetical protein KGQ20_05425 [Catenulispora sp. NF23]|uniref:hypothetical protein n=1 Tax=Catenulispora pinistramenti TaxID=2705254 RepID=UPI001BA5370C|nr:hypothetical protein [Catenulispora pinistramenti]MBS2532207.1 hypothetical protein [Catenulispora pinistramenti]
MDIAWIFLETGRQIDLIRLEVVGTYDFLEGYPTASWNDRLLAGLAERMKTGYPRATNHIVEPSRTTPDDGPNGPFGPMELFPPITCIGLFRSGPIDDEADSMLTESVLAVAWFQDGPDLPVSDAMRTALERLDWDALAHDRER